MDEISKNIKYKRFERGDGDMTTAGTELANFLTTHPNIHIVNISFNAYVYDKKLFELAHLLYY